MIGYEDLSEDELKKDIEYSKRIVPFLAGDSKKIYEEWILKKEIKLKQLEENHDRLIDDC